MASASLKSLALVGALAVSAAGVWIYTQSTSEPVQAKAQPQEDRQAAFLEVLSASFEPNAERFAGARKPAAAWLTEHLKQSAAKLHLTDEEVTRQMEAWAQHLQARLGARPYHLAMACFLARDYEKAAGFAARAYQDALKSKGEGRAAARAAARVWAESLMELLRFGDAVNAYDKVLALTDSGKEQLAWIQALEAKAYALWNDQHYPEMEESLETAVQARATRPELQGQAICYSLTFLAKSYQRQLRVREGQAALQEALNRMASLPEISPVVQYEALCEAAQLSGLVGANEEAIIYLVRAQEIARQAGPLPGLDPGQAILQLGSRYVVMRRFDEATEWINKSIEHYEKAGSKGDLKLAEALGALAQTQMQQEKTEEAIATAKRCVAVVETLPAEFENEQAIAYNLLGLTHLSAGKYDVSENLLKRAVALREKLHGPDHYQVAKPLGDLACVYMAQKRFGEAEPLLWDVVGMEMRATVTMGKFTPGLVDHTRFFLATMGNLGIAETTRRDRVMELAREAKMSDSQWKDLAEQLMKR
ncbi:MAG: tetratricopeptide repeat protein [Verrucomicrobiota bacterium]